MEPLQLTVEQICHQAHAAVDEHPRRVTAGKAVGAPAQRGAARGAHRSCSRNNTSVSGGAGQACSYPSCMALLGGVSRGRGAYPTALHGHGGASYERPMHSVGGIGSSIQARACLGASPTALHGRGGASYGRPMQCDGGVSCSINQAQACPVGHCCAPSYGSLGVHTSRGNNMLNIWRGGCTMWPPSMAAVDGVAEGEEEDYEDEVEEEDDEDEAEEEDAGVDGNGNDELNRFDTPHWTKMNIYHFCDLWLREMRIENCPNGEMSRVGFHNLIENYQRLVGYYHSVPQMRRRYSKCKDMYVFWRKTLNHTGTTIGPLGEIRAPFGWWITAGKREFQIFQHRSPSYMQLLIDMFSGLPVDGSRSYNPLHAYMQASEARGGESGDVEGGNQMINHITSSTHKRGTSSRATGNSSSKRTKSPIVKAVIDLMEKAETCSEKTREFVEYRAHAEFMTQRQLILERQNTILRTQREDATVQTGDGS
ncbi:uncharacterized protein LOC120694165 isoform X1 [Panicum virgatum]|uniref:Myb/SANT-like domain-containing protein n=1 Tax=Panicum virgatum TaxID=38727 RepID=A0A8T0P440_PANVG|nr:uncharacterized protein LOC120685990 isoform X1 [Panicum virgatum]XP_039833158.1 uncharacterized protein LOC120694047 isoform X1 [Panicum virgatum]XP_039833272.1 uncharacterized protein LOC120694165 isoform X1 [Panicum virgatum]KAG2481312.1 hypothetical protein PVAP13_J683422 [Panicum virgatum]KAG2481501.1 hypothetical protein PVAP13_J683906 [Panicum virgatum]KAG2555495.1 hypothetical protein PVAP13_8NG030964 [Panicum virgatum]